MDIGDDQPVFGENTFSLHYRKINNRDLFSSLENSELGIKSSRNYIPLYENYFNLNETNYNSINLNQRFYVSALSGVVDKNNIQAAAVDAFKSTSDSLTIVHKPIFIKFSPLIDPVKYMSGKYQNLNMNTELLNIPTLSKLEKQGHLKANDKNNSAYVDGFFSYLSSQVLNCHDFIHGLNYYGSFNAIKSEFYYNVFDDIDYLDKNTFFTKNKTILFDIEDIEYFNDSETNSNCSQTKHSRNTRNKKNKIIIDKTDNIHESNNIIVHDDFDKINNELNSIFNTSPVLELSSSSVSSTSPPTSTTLLQNIIVSDIESDIVSDIKTVYTDTFLFEAIPLDDIEIAINENDGKITLNRNNDSDGDDSTTSGSCSSRSSYTSESGNETGNIEDSVYGGGGAGDGDDAGGKKLKQKNGKNGKNGKNKSKSFSEDSFSGDNSDDESGSQSGSEDDNDEYDDEDDYDDDEETLWATIKNFPVSAIMLEKCDNTLDSLMMQEKEMTENEWTSALMQIIMTLITYQKLFGFTHNDLHTNNVMFIYTEKEYIYYLFNKKYYRVPTYNRAFKIIDFGRAIYKYKSKVICSDSFSMTGDAATQYNCEPYFNDKKARLEPNFSFDLCRLGCSIFDYFIDNINDVEKICKKEPLAKLIVEWVTDDHNRNILYKTNGEERYPDFKLYKMIARNVHNHTPHTQLSKPIFAAYEFPKKKVKTTHRIINIDKMPCYME
uniref:Protein kinase domain-containing protein n=1 Tax=viral metagenome TaxID=1070528 RepID=A0A6C0EZ03_9ZZZZ